MFLGIAGPDRKLLMIGGALLFVMLTASVALSPPEGSMSSPVPSTYSTQSAGAKAAYLLLSQLHYPVRRWEEAPTELPKDGSNTLLILSNPTQTPSKKEREALKTFVESGGHVLFTGPNIGDFFRDATVSWKAPDPEWVSYAPNFPSAISRKAPRITIQPQAYWREPTEEQLALYGDADSRAVVSWQIDDGAILWWCGPTPLINSGITKDDNLAFFLNSVSNSSPGNSYQIYWDEYFHGQRSSLWSYTRNTPLTWALMQIGLVAAAVIFTFGRRRGPVYRQATVSRLSPLEFVDTLGGLYQRAGAGSSAVAVSQSRLRYLLTRQFGLPGDTPDVQLAQAAEQRLGWKDFTVENVLGRADVASRAAKLKSRLALDLVQELERHAQKLEVHPRLSQEKT
jgi:Domain of unknown function (DUF4350)